MSVNEKMTAITDAIRGYTGGTDKLSLEKIAAAIPAVFGAGEAQRDKAWRERVYVSETSFNDTNGITVELPFVPDKLCIISFDAFTMSTASTYYVLLFDRASFSQRCALQGVVDDTLTVRTATLSNSTRDNYFAVSGGTVTFTPAQSFYWQTGLWRSNAKYAILAYTSGKSDRQLLEEEIAALPEGGGTVTFSQARVLETVTETEWEELITAKGNWTFNLV